MRRTWPRMTTQMKVVSGVCTLYLVFNLNISDANTRFMQAYTAHISLLRTFRIVFHISDNVPVLKPKEGGTKKNKNMEEHVSE